MLPTRLVENGSDENVARRSRLMQSRRATTGACGKDATTRQESCRFVPVQFAVACVQEVWSRWPHILSRTHGAAAIPRADGDIGRMKRVTCGSAALIAFAVAAPAQAADIGTAPAYKVPLTAASPWSGFYAGLGLGSRATRTDAVTSSETIGGIPQNLADGRPTGASFDGLGFRSSF